MARKQGPEAERSELKRTDPFAGSTWSRKASQTRSIEKDSSEEDAADRIGKISAAREELTNLFASRNISLYKGTPLYSRRVDLLQLN